MPHPRITTAYLSLALACSGVFALSLLHGSVAIEISQVWNSLAGHGSPLVDAVIFDLRLPRALTAFAAGGLLALAGVLMQVLLRNPLADPFVMGISGGSAAAALAAMLLGLTGLSVSVAATLGALATTLLVFALAHGEGGWTPGRLLLTGVVIAAGASAVVSTLLALGDDTRLRGMLFWLMGDLSFSSRPAPLLALFCIAIVIALPFARHLNVLARGELQARILGVPVRGLRISIFVASSVLTGFCVTATGTIGFVGLVTPHLVRLMVGADHRAVMPATALLGGTLVMLADLLARTMVAPRQLPVGALTAIAGVPLFLMLMRRQNSK